MSLQSKTQTDSQLTILDSTEGHISACSSSGCGYRCCQFQQDNYIVMYPGELALAMKKRYSTKHLKMFEQDELGGHRVICNACDTSSCDQGYKPLDCASYPYFPVEINEGASSLALIGEKCPLAGNQLDDHMAWVVKKWAQLLAQSHVIQEWVLTVRLVGYKKVVISAKADDVKTLHPALENEPTSKVHTKSAA